MSSEIRVSFCMPSRDELVYRAGMLAVAVAETRCAAGLREKDSEQQRKLAARLEFQRFRLNRDRHAAALSLRDRVCQRGERRP